MFPSRFRTLPYEFEATDTLTGDIKQFPPGYFQVGIVMDCHGVQSGHNSNMGIVTQNIANNSNIGNCEVLER